MNPKIISDPDKFLQQRKNKTVVFTNGCFDLLHEGHLHLLQEAKKSGDILIVAVNTDASVKKLKGEGRPVENERERMEKLAALHEVDFIISFSEDTPLSLIEKIRPDILVKGGDYKEKEIVGAELIKNYGGKIMIIPLLEGYSTTSIINDMP